MRALIVGALLAGCSLDVDYTGTYYQCNPDGSCPPNYECVDMVCVPTDPVPPACSTDVSAGGGHACSVRTDGTVWCWGRNDYGQLGNGTAVDSDEPVKVEGLTSAMVQVGAGDIHTCALDRDGLVYCWGRNEAGQLGDGTNSDSRAPVEVRDVVGATQIAIGHNHSCVLRGDGGVSCWGSNGDGQLGDGSTTNRSAAAAVMLSPAKHVGAGGDTTCAVLGDGSVQCWGENNDGELGVGDLMARNRPTPVLDITGMLEVAPGDDFTCATGMATYCWGANSYGQLGDGTTTDSNRPVPVLAPVGLVDVEAGNEHVCGKDALDQLWCWGQGGDGRLMDGGWQSRSLPARSLLEDVDVFSAGGEHTCVLDKAGAIRCGGFNRRGQLGDGRRVTYGEPQLVQGIANATLIAAGGEHTCAALADGQVMCWGANDDGAAGDGSYTSEVVLPHVVYGITHPKQLVAGGEHTCALLQDDSVYCWGDNEAGQLGDGSNRSSSQPRGVGSTPTALGVADGASCGLVTGDAECWGNLFGTTPVTVSEATSIAGGGGHICRVPQDQTVMCFGYGGTYQLGNGVSTSNVAAPGVQATGVTGAVEVQARGSSTCARLGDGSVMCWGLNGGRLGVGNESYATTMPSPVMGLSGITKLAMGWDASCALKPGGSLWCWGHNNLGQTGDGSYQTRLAPVQILALSNVKDVASGGSHSCAINGDGTVWCWGAATRGQLGNGIRYIGRPVGVRMTCP